MAAEDFLVAIELGSSAVTGLAGRRKSDGSMQVLAVAQEPSSSFIRKGVIFNVDKTAQCLSSIINRLQKVLKMKIGMVYVGVAGQGLHTEKNIISFPLGSQTVISQEIVDRMLDNNACAVTNDHSIFDVVPQEYRVGTVSSLDPVGVQGDNIDGTFLNVIGRKSVHDTRLRCFKQADILVADTFIAPMALADGVLSDTDKRSGCILVDLGADTTTVSIYRNNLLRQLSVVPIGSDNITKDIATVFQIESEEAEQLKLKYGSAYTELPKEGSVTETSEKDEIKLSDGRIKTKTELNEIIEARVEEIVKNVDNQISYSEYSKSSLLGGLVLTGGAAIMKNLDRAFVAYMSFDKLKPKIAKNVNFTVESSLQEFAKPDIRFNSILSILAKGDKNCCAGSLTEKPINLFDDAIDKQPVPNPDIEDVQRRRQEELEKQKAEELARIEKEKAEEKQRAAEEKEKEKKEKKEKRKKVLDGVKSFFTKLVNED